MQEVSFIKSCQKSAFCVRCSFVHVSEKSELVVLCLFLLSSCSFGTENQTFLQNISGKKSEFFQQEMKHDPEYGNSWKRTAWGMKEMLLRGWSHIKLWTGRDNTVTRSAGKELGVWMQLDQQLSPLVG